MCIDNPREGFSNIFDTHPPVEKRVEALVKFAGGHDPGPLAIEEGNAQEQLAAPEEENGPEPSAPPPQPWGPEPGAPPPMPPGPWGPHRDR
jgi:heat shock protein HtpX